VGEAEQADRSGAEGGREGGGGFYGRVGGKKSERTVPMLKSRTKARERVIENKPQP
jgi:hypothetical protein